MASISPKDPGRNWAGNYRYRAKELYEPQSVAQIQELVKRSGKIKALGSRHCFNEIADTDGIQISTRFLEPVIEIDEVSMSVTISSGLTYGDLCPRTPRARFCIT